MNIRPRRTPIGLAAVTWRYSSIGILDHGMRTIPTAHGFTVPLALFILVLDCFRVTGKFLLRGGRLRRGERFGVGRKGFRKHAIDLVGPATVMLNDFVSNIGSQ